MHDHFHLVSSIEPNQDGFTLQCRCNVEEYDRLATILCEGNKTIQCLFTVVSRGQEVVEYQVVIPELPGDKCVFWAMTKDGQKRGIWKPSTDLQAASLPTGFFFPGRFLSLAYEKGKTITERSKDQNNFFAGLTGIWRKDSDLIFSGYLFLPAQSYNTNTLQLKIVKFREENIQSTHPVSVSPADETVLGYYELGLYPEYGGNTVYKFLCKVDMNSIKNHYGYFNIFIQHNESLVSPSNFNNSLPNKDHCYPAILSPLKRALFIPFYNEFFEKWRLDIYHMSVLEWLQLRLFYRKCAAEAPKKETNIWLIGEYLGTARDNGMHFYNYLCRKKKSGIKAYYVIYKDSSQRHNLAKKNILYYGSYRHFKIAAKAGVLVFSHMPEFLVPKINAIVRYREKLTQFKTVFIQHGVIATTASVLIYHKKTRKINRFVVSSSFEKQIICDHLGYNDKEVVVTGLARWDNLLAASKKSTDILIMPTWRNNLENVSKAVFKQSSYYTFWNGLLSDKDFLNLIRNNKIAVTFFLHIGLAQFADCFELPPEIQMANEDHIQKLLSTCGLLVTDYSSVAFDVLLQEKPVVFCPFDYDEMMVLRKGPEFINYEEDLPGPVCYDVESTVREITNHATKGNTIDTPYRERRKKFFDHIDKHNCDRLYKEIKTLIGM